MINPNISNILISILIIFIIISIKSKKYKKSIILSSLMIVMISSNYIYFTRQGATSYLHNPIDMLKASKLAPKPNQTSNINALTSISDEDKKNTIFVIYKFGCPDCQRLWIYANEHKELLPSKNVKWISSTEYSKNKSEDLPIINRYPTVIYWDDIDNQLKEKITMNPAGSELEGLITRIKTYQK
jgi:hypothetical protein